MLVQIDFLLVINTNVLPILHRFQDIAFDTSKIAVLDCPLAFNAPDGGVPYDDIMQRTASSGALNARRVAKYSDFGRIEGYISETVQDKEVSQY